MVLTDALNLAQLAALVIGGAGVFVRMGVCINRIDSIGRAVDRLEAGQRDHADRLARVETRTSTDTPGPRRIVR